METKTNQIKGLLDAGQVNKAISIASKFFDRSEDTKLFKQAQAAIQNPGFYKQIGKDPDAIVAQATELLAKRFA